MTWQTVPSHGANIMYIITQIIYSIKYQHGFVMLCSVVIVLDSFLVDLWHIFIHILQGCLTGSRTTVRSPQCKWSYPQIYGYFPEQNHTETQRCVNQAHSQCSAVNCRMITQITHKSSLLKQHIINIMWITIIRWNPNCKVNPFSAQLVQRNIDMYSYFDLIHQHCNGAKCWTTPKTKLRNGSFQSISCLLMT